MVIPKKIGKEQVIENKKPGARKQELQVMVPLKNEIRMVEAFDARPAQGVQEIITGDNSSFEFLRLARLFLDEVKEVERSLDKEEALYYVNRGKVKIETDGEIYELGKGDVLYVSIDSKLKITCKEKSDLSEFKAIKCHTKYPVKLVRHTDIEGTELAADLGNKRPMSKRTVFKLIDKNVETNRLLFGDTYMQYRGGVGSYPPHFHGAEGPHGLGGKAKEEIYHFRCESDIEGDIPYVLQNCALPEEKVNVYVHIFDETAINVTPSFHDTIAPPSVDFMFTWCLASFTEGYRDWGEIYNKPGYEGEW